MQHGVGCGGKCASDVCFHSRFALAASRQVACVHICAGLRVVKDKLVLQIDTHRHHELSALVTVLHQVHYS